MRSGPLWAVTSYFNPQRYRTRSANFQAFRGCLEVPLVAVELSFDGRFELAPDAADIVVRVQGGDVMWQKERLLNIGRAHLPAACEMVAMVDADIVFSRPDWDMQATRLLGDVPVVQLYSHVHYLPAGARPDDAAVATHESIASAATRGEDPAAALADPGADGRGRWLPGMAWAYRRELLDRHGLYDGSIIGGGDTAMACAGWGAFGAVESRHCMTPAQRRYFRAWAEPWHDEVGGRIGCVEGIVSHLWHGSIGDRGNAERHRRLEAHGFDPYRDLAGHASGAWRWASEKPALHRAVADYFASRREDA